MMLKIVLLACLLLHLAIAAPQFLTFRDGKFGVNFGGYHAEAGLGGLLTGNAAHGGLSASAGTPLGQNAGAGIGGSVDGNAAGLLYAGAEANPQTGAAAILGGDTSKGGYGGSVAYSPRATIASISQHLFSDTNNAGPNTVTSSPSNGKDETYYDGIQKIRPPKKYLIKPSTLSGGKDKNRNYSDRKTTITHQKFHSADSLNRAHGISTATRNTLNHNDDNNDDDGEDTATAATSTAVEKREYAVKRIATMQHPATSIRTANTADIAIATKNEDHINSERRDEVPQPVLTTRVDATGAQGKLGAVPPPPAAIVVSRQRLRQKSRNRPQRLQKRVRQRERARLVETQQRGHGTESESVGAGDEQQSGLAHHTQYAAQASSASANASANSNASPAGHVAYSKHLSKRVENQNFGASVPSPLPDLNLNLGPSVVTSALNIPIGILRSLQETLGGLGAAKQDSFAMNS